MDGGVLAGRFLAGKQFSKIEFPREAAVGRDFGGTRLRYIADRMFRSVGGPRQIDNVPNVVMRKRDLPG